MGALTTSGLHSPWKTSSSAAAMILWRCHRIALCGQNRISPTALLKTDASVWTPAWSLTHEVRSGASALSQVPADAPHLPHLRLPRLAWLLLCARARRPSTRQSPPFSTQRQHPALGPSPTVFQWETTSCILRLRRISSPDFFILTLHISTRLRNCRKMMVTAALKRFWSRGRSEAGGETSGATAVVVKPGVWTRLGE